MSDCERVRLQCLLLGNGVSQYTADARKHLERCHSCAKFVYSITFLDQFLIKQPSYSAPQGLIDSSLKLIRHQHNDKQLQPKMLRAKNQRINKFAIAITLIASINLCYQVYNPYTINGEFYGTAAVHANNKKGKILRSNIGHYDDSDRLGVILSAFNKPLFPFDNDGNSINKPAIFYNHLAYNAHLLSNTASSFSKPIYPYQAYYTADRIPASATLGSQFLTSIQSMQNIEPQPTSGYWANTYVPVDKNKNQIAAQLRRWNRARLFSLLSSGKTLEQLSVPVDQPFDFPLKSALALYLSSDHAAILGQSRIRLQVGLQGSNPAINSPVQNQQSGSAYALQTIAQDLLINIQLSPNVFLLNVIGSRPLNSINTKNTAIIPTQITNHAVKQANSTIQIKIPAYLARDTHIILLDLLVSNPGPIAEVSLSYDDLLYRRHDFLQVSSNLPSGLQRPGSLEINVFNNLLAQLLKQSLFRVSDFLENKEYTQALTELQLIKRLYSELQQLLPGLDLEITLANDILMLNQFEILLSASQDLSAQDLNYLHSTLLLAGWRKIFSQNHMRQYQAELGEFY